MGLLIFESPEASAGIKEGEIVEIDPDEGIIRNLSVGAIFKVASIPVFMKQLVEDGGLIAHFKKNGANPNV